ncbi:MULTISPECIES: hypothetical protein [unclassified Microcoleus]|uniref:hypothetical protein n=1 Tax=unclassified Microcoleus TaxID=2642155 RepID=UPI002FD0F0A2
MAISPVLIGKQLPVEAFSSVLSNRRQMKATSIQRGSDRFFRPASSLPGSINLFPKAVKLAAGDLQTVWDLEATGRLNAGELRDAAAIAELSDKVIANIKVF